MSVRLLICDDSSMARKQLLRALPPDWELDVTQASNGLEGLAAIRAGKAQLVLLDLTMPELDGYGVLKAIRDEGHTVTVVVVSGDVQEQAVNRVMALGAREFLQKPVDALDLRKVLRDPYLSLRAGKPVASGAAEPISEAEWVSESAASTPASTTPASTTPATAPPTKPAGNLAETLAAASVPFRDAFREVNNVAMGRAAALLAKVLGVFVKLPIPNVNLLEVGELHMALADAKRGGTVSSVCQGFIAGGIAGEALLIFHDSSYQDMAKLLKVEGAVDQSSELELLMDMASVLIGACLNGVAEQLDVRFSQGHPMVLGRHCAVDELIRVNQGRWKKTLAVEISYGIEHHSVYFDLLLLFTEDSIPRLTDKMGYLMS